MSTCPPLGKHGELRKLFDDVYFVSARRLSADEGAGLTDVANAVLDSLDD
jgi:hypothetical protein